MVFNAGGSGRVWPSRWWTAVGRSIGWRLTGWTDREKRNAAERLDDEDSYVVPTVAIDASEEVMEGWHNVLECPISERASFYIKLTPVASVSLSFSRSAVSGRPDPFVFFPFFSPSPLPRSRERPEEVEPWLDRYRSVAPALSRSWIDRGYGRWAVVDRAARDLLEGRRRKGGSDRRGGRGTNARSAIDEPKEDEPGLEEGFLAIDSPRQQAVRGVRAPRCKCCFCLPSPLFLAFS